MKAWAHGALWLALFGTADASMHLKLSQRLDHVQPKPAPAVAAPETPAPMARTTRQPVTHQAARPAPVKRVVVAKAPKAAPAPQPVEPAYRIVTVPTPPAEPAPKPGIALSWPSEPSTAMAAAPAVTHVPATTAPIALLHPQAEPAGPSTDILPVALNSSSALVFDQTSGRTLLAKNADLAVPIASITKLMTAVLVLEAHQDMNEKITLIEDDRDTLKWSGSRLPVGATYTRGQLLHLALIASDNRAAHALGRTYPGGIERFVAAMNRTARKLEMNDTAYVEPTGLSYLNRSTAHDLARLVDHAWRNYPEIGEITSTGRYDLGTQRVVLKKKHKKPQVYYRTVAFNNTNRLTRNDDWQIGLSKTGFINEAGHCLVMQARVAGRNTVIVLLDAGGNNSRAGDATRIKTWLESGNAPVPPIRSASRT